jgi:hypothetical protein
MESEAMPGMIPASPHERRGVAQLGSVGHVTAMDDENIFFIHTPDGHVQTRC